MSYKTLTYQRMDQVALIHLVGPSNDLVSIARLSDELSELCIKITWDEKIRVVTITGVGEKNVFTGTDLVRAVSRIIEGTLKVWSLAEPIAKLDRPVIVTLNGDVFGLGLEMALACDIRIATEKSRFGLPHIQAGLIPWDGGSQRLGRIVGKAKAMEMILTGDIIDAQEANRIGLIHRVVPSEELMDHVLKMANDMASKGPIALKYAKEAINKGMEMSLEQGLHLEADLYLLLHTTRDRIEGIKAFRERRSPKFEGK